MSKRTQSKPLLTQKRRLSGSSFGGSSSGFLARLGADSWLKVACAALILFPWAALFVVVGMRSFPQRDIYKELPGGKKCVGWRETYFCHPFAERYGPGDKGCDEPIIPAISGYCLCEDNITTARVTCGPKHFTCRQKCMELAYNPIDALVLPTPISCPYDVPYAPEEFLHGMQPAPPEWAMNAQLERQKVAPTWEALWAAIHAHGISNISTPSIRNETHDFVRERVKIPRSTVQTVRSQLDAFKAQMPPMSPTAFNGRGIVTVGGGLRYIVPAWINIHQLRHLGCKLPIEMWYPLAEYPTQPVIDAFARLGVTTRPLDFQGLDIPAPFDKKTLLNDPQNMARFTIKIAAVVLSSFKEIIWLDVDNIPLRDPSFLYDSEEYKATGALFWQDYWANTMAPQAEQMLGVPKEKWYPGSFESGQMVIDKARHWRGLLAATYLNSYAHFFYEIFTGYLGKGDKETFAYGMATMGEPYYVIPTPPASLGTKGTSMQCSARTQLCRDEFTGNTMVQYDLQGNVLFLHANLHKWDMRLPEKFSLHYQRRWHELQPGGIDWQAWMAQHLGYDLERKLYDLIRMLKCAPWWEEYEMHRLKVHHDKGTLPLDGFHYLLRGIEFDRMYKQGWGGNYMQLVKYISATDKIQHWFNGQVRPVVQRLHLAKR